MRRRLRLIGAAVAALGLPVSALADATLPVPQPAVDEDAGGKADADPPIECGSARGKAMQKALVAWCATASDETERRGCRYLVASFRRCSRKLTIDNGYERHLTATVPLPERKDTDPLYATATFRREERGYQVTGVELWEDCP